VATARSKLARVNEAQFAPDAQFGPGDQVAPEDQVVQEDQVAPADQLGPEDLKIVTLARSARARTGSPEGAAVRDETGRTYSATTVALPSLRLSALAVAVAMAVSSGARSLEAAALVTGPDKAGLDMAGLDTAGLDADLADVRAVRDLGPDALIIYAAPDGSIVRTIRP
jgi:hypothetical protein